MARAARVSATESQREESGESQFQGSLWRATLSRKAWMPIWGLSTESDFASPPPGGGCRAKAAEMAGEGGGSRNTTRTDPSRTERLHPGKAQTTVIRARVGRPIPFRAVVTWAVRIDHTPPPVEQAASGGQDHTPPPFWPEGPYLTP